LLGACLLTKLRARSAWYPAPPPSFSASLLGLVAARRPSLKPASQGAAGALTLLCGRRLALRPQALRLRTPAAL